MDPLKISHDGSEHFSIHTKADSLWRRRATKTTEALSGS
jgi:hypothetical protein